MSPSPCSSCGSTPVIRPPGYSRVTVSQLQRTDQEIFRRLADASRGALNPNPYGAMPLDPLVPAILDSATVRMLLAPLPSPQQPKQQQAAQQDRRTQKRTRSPSPPPKQPGSSTGKGSAKNPKKPRQAAFPKNLAGSAVTKAGDAICFGYNSGACKFGAACRRKHVCTKCEGNHPYIQCPTK